MAQRSPAPTTEDELIGWLRRRTARSGGRWIGDDAAILPQSARWAVTVDSQIEGVHFQPGLDSSAIARRLLAVNLSDLAAMGAVPSYAFLALSAPPDFAHRRFFSALLEACEEIDLELAGGDLSRQPSVNAVLTLLGRKPSGQRWLRREGARVGDRIWLGGTVGEAAVGLRLLQLGASLEPHSVRLPRDVALSPRLAEAARRAVRRQILPRPQLELGHWLGSRPSGAAIDVSDGLTRDLYRLCAASGVGARLELDRLPLSRDLQELAGVLGLDWRRAALGGGEDYVLLFTLPGGIEPPRRLGCSRVGIVVEDEISLLDGNTSSLLPDLGWDHLSARDRRVGRDPTSRVRQGLVESERE